MSNEKNNKVNPNIKRFTKIEKLSQNPFLNLFKMDAFTEKGKPFSYYFVSRNKDENLKCKTGDNKAEGVVVYALLKDEPEKIVLIKQYRYPLNRFIYELPAGLIDNKESASVAAIREMKEETGLLFEVYSGGKAEYRKPYFMGAGFTDESSQTVYGYASGAVSDSFLEESESIQVILADKKEAARILREEELSIRCAYLLMHFIHSNLEKPFAFLEDE
ncbi:MAG: NUDIX hydrolase [Clostridiales bacterium]|nr:NUDIX hydrolase [Clostridiales bacterium]